MAEAQLSVVLKAIDELTPALQAAAQKAAGTMATMQSQLNSAGKAMTSAGRNISMYVTAPLTAAGLASFKAAGDFDQAFRAVNVTLGATADEAERYKSRILEISSATGKAAGDVTSAFYQIVSSGYKGAESLDIMEVAVRGATGGAADLASTAAALTKAMNIFSLEGAGGATRAMDAFMAVVDVGLLSFEEMVSAFPQAATLAAPLNISLEETGAALASLTKVSGSTDEAATALNATFAQLITPSEALQALYTEWGVATGPQAIEKFGGLSGVLQQLQVATGGEVDKLAELFPNIRSIRAVLPLVTTNSADFASALDAVTNASGRTGRAFEEMAQGPGFEWQQMTNNMRNAAIELGDAVSDTLGPMLVSATKAITGAVRAFSDLSPTARTAAVVVGAVAAATGPLLVGLGMMSTGLASLIGLYRAIATAQLAARAAMLLQTTVTHGVAAAQWLLNAAMTANPIGIVVVAIGALVAALVWLWRNNDTVREKLTAAWNGIRDFFVDVWDRITGLFEGGMGDILRLVMLPVTWPVELAKHWDAIKDAMLKPLLAARDAIAGIMDRIKELLSPLTSGESAGGAIGIGGLSEIRKLQLGGRGGGLDMFASGGVIAEPTLLYGLRSQRPYAIAGESGPEAVIPPGMGGVTINVAALHVREEADVPRIARELHRLMVLEGAR